MNKVAYLYDVIDDEKLKNSKVKAERKQFEREERARRGSTTVKHCSIDEGTCWGYLVLIAIAKCPPFSFTVSIFSIEFH